MPKTICCTNCSGVTTAMMQPAMQSRTWNARCQGGAEAAVRAPMGGGKAALSAEKKKAKNLKAAEVPRPEARLASVDLWAVANPNSAPRRYLSWGRGGGRLIHGRCRRKKYDIKIHI